MNTLNNKLLELAKDAGANVHEYVDGPGTPAIVSYELTAGGLERFASLVLSAAQEEREPAAQTAGVPEAWRKFIEDCSKTAGGMVNGNHLSTLAYRLLAAAPQPVAQAKGGEDA